MIMSEAKIFNTGEKCIFCWFWHVYRLSLEHCGFFTFIIFIDLVSIRELVL